LCEKVLLCPAFHETMLDKDIRISTLLLQRSAGNEMARPRKRRRVCFSPEHREFGPLGQGPWTREWTIHMLLEELEAIRLIDLEGLTQEECAARMGVARSTVQRIYQEARRKVAESLVHGKRLVVYGEGQAFPEEDAPANLESLDLPPDCETHLEDCGHRWGRGRRGRGFRPAEDDDTKR